MSTITEQNDIPNGFDPTQACILVDWRGTTYQVTLDNLRSVMPLTMLSIMQLADESKSNE